MPTTRLLIRILKYLKYIIADARRKKPLQWKGINKHTQTKFHSNSTVVIHVGSNNITHRNSEDFNADKLADEIIDIGKMCRQYGVKDVIFSSIFMKNSIKLGAMKS